ncbi:hypothetical protein B0H14DRAFT_3085313 [Mycena olivaceomarginata]|nr:hypothetical protein B0H14DRAFT_3085313 [Mycena olivaceomarginata]
MQIREPEPESSQLQVVGVVTFYIVAALVMIIINKAVLNNTPDLPFTLLFIQCLIAVLLLRLLSWVNTTSLRRVNPIDWETPKIHHGVMVDLFPYFAVGISGLVFNTLCLTNVDASFFQIARGLALPFTVAVSAAHNHVRPRLQVVVAAFIVTCGFFIGTAPKSETALFYGSMSSLLLAVHAVLKKSALGHVGNSVITLSYFGNIVSTALLLACMILHGEVGVLRNRFQDLNMDWTPFLVGSAVTGFFGFLLGIANSLSVKVTSPVTHMFSSAAKGVIQTILGVCIFSDVITLSRFYSIAIIIGGTVYYTYIQTSKPKKTLPEE